MSSSIKPPGNGPRPIDPVGASTDAGRTRADRSEGFDQALETSQASNSQGSATHPAATTAASGARGAEGVTNAEGVLADLRAGRIDGAAAVERLVAEALKGPMAAGLTPGGRVALEAHLRASLEDDPNLAALVRDLDR